MDPRIEYRRAVNKADNKAATVSIDSLINYEAVKVCHPLRFSDVRTYSSKPHQHFNNERYEIAQYDKHLASYEKSATKVATSLAYLNSGQNVIFSSALTLMMLLAAQGVLNGTGFVQTAA